MIRSLPQLCRWCALGWAAATLHLTASTAQTSLASSQLLQHQQPAFQGQKLVSMQLDNLPIGEAVERVARQFGADVGLNPKLLPNRSINVKLVNATLQEAFGQILQGTLLEAVILPGNSIIIREKTTQQAAPKAQITGKVTDAGTGSPLPGVNIILKGSALGTTTTSEGTYAINVADESGILVYSYIGYNPEEVPIAGKTVIDVSLIPSIQSLNQVVVIGYGTQQRKDITASIGSVSQQELQTVSKAGIDQALQGRVAGVQVTQTSGQPGGTVNIRVRGWSSISAGNEPLYVIDGVPLYNWGTTLNNGPAGIFGTGVVHNALSAINPNDIESIHVLKDAAAAAIYGSRAANGVIIVTTKRGKAGKGRIELDSYYGTQQMTRRFDLLNSGQYVGLINESRANARANEGIADPYSGSVGLRQIPGLENPSDFTQTTDWQDQIFQSAPIQNHQLTISGGNENTQYSVSGGYFNQQGVVIESGYKRYSARFNLDQQVNNRLKIGNSLTINNATNTINRASSGGPNQGGVIYGALLQTPIIPVYDENGEFARPDYRYFDRIDNPVASARDYWHTINTTRMIGNVYGELGLHENLKFRTSIGLDANYLKNNIFIPTRGWSEGPPPGPGSGFAFASQELVWLNENTLTYSRVFNKRHDVSAVGGVSLQGAKFERMISRVFNFPNDLVITTNGGQTNLTNSFAEEWRLASFLGRVNYTLDNKYLITLAARSDGSSRFGPDRRFGFFPSVSAGWRLSEENFLKQLDFLSDLKIRASYGLTGNSEIVNTVNSFANYAHLGSVATANYAFGGNIVNGLAPASLTNRELGWESTSQADIGLDIGLFNNRIEIVLDYYNKTTKDMLVGNTPLPFTTGYGSSIQNVGSLRNRGWEAAINSVNLAGSFGWTTSINFARNQNEVISLGRDVKEINLGNSIIRPGSAVSSFYGFVQDRIFTSTEDVLASPRQEANTSPGDIKFKDLNLDGVIDNADRAIIGNPLPDYIFGMTNTFTFMGLELSVFLNGVSGNEIVNFTRSRTENMGGFHNQSVTTLNRWRSADEPGDGKMPRATAVDPNRNNRFSDRWVEDGSYLRVRTLSLGYTFPQSLLGRAKLSNLKVYATAQNFFTFTRYTGFDPEVGNSGNSPLEQGYDNSNYPLPRTLFFGINVQF